MINVGIVDYGIGNIAAFERLLAQIGVGSKRIIDSREMDACEALLIPGVGHFDHAMQKLNSSGLRCSLDRAAGNGRQKIIGICVGMQMMAHRSEEGVEKGLCWIDGDVKVLVPDRSASRGPVVHVGWNTVNFSGNFSADGEFYFLHSYYFDVARQENTVGTSRFSKDFPAIVRSGNIWGIQFHPEKSHASGRRLITNILATC